MSVGNMGGGRQERLDRQLKAMLKTGPRQDCEGGIGQGSGERRSTPLKLSTSLSQEVQRNRSMVTDPMPMRTGRGRDPRAGNSHHPRRYRPPPRALAHRRSAAYFRPRCRGGSGARSRRSLAAMMHMVHHGGRRGMVGQTFELAEVAKAHEVIAGRDLFGKVVLRVP